MNLPPILDWEEMKDVIRFVFVPNYYELELYRKLHGWKITSTMMLKEYTEIQKMISQLHPNDNEERKEHRFITGLIQAIQNEFFLFHITMMHKAMAQETKVEFKLKKVPSSTTRARFTNSIHSWSNFCYYLTWSFSLLELQGTKSF